MLKSRVNRLTSSLIAGLVLALPGGKVMADTLSAGGCWPCLSARGLRLSRQLSSPRTRADRAGQSTGSRPHSQRTRPRHPCQNPRGESPCGSCCRASLPWPSTPAPPQPPPLKAPTLAQSRCCCRSGGCLTGRLSSCGRGIGVRFWIVVGRSRCSVGGSPYILIAAM